MQSMWKTLLTALRDPRYRRRFAAILGGKMLGLVVLFALMAGIAAFFGSHADAQNAPENAPAATAPAANAPAANAPAAATAAPATAAPAAPAAPVKLTGNEPYISPINTAWTL